jgi:hypothetical protein
VKLYVFDEQEPEELENKVNLFLDDMLVTCEEISQIKFDTCMCPSPSGDGVFCSFVCYMLVKEKK